MQLVAYGAQDAFLTGNPEITFFKVVYRRHTNFAMESIVQDFNGSGQRKTATISRNGDLITNCWLEGCKGTSNIESIDLEIGGQRIDKHYGQWMAIWTELSCPVGKRAGKDSLDQSGTVPLEFFFCRNPGLALPLIALQYHEVKLTFNLKSNADEMKLYVDYIYLDTDERRRFAQVQHNMLIDQLQQQDGAASGTNTRLNFNHPCKELVWLGSGSGESTLKLNGHERFSRRNADYFQKVQPYQHHTNVPMQNLNSIQRAVVDFSTEDAITVKVNGRSTGAELNSLTMADLQAAGWRTADETRMSVTVEYIDGSSYKVDGKVMSNADYSSFITDYAKKTSEPALSVRGSIATFVLNKQAQEMTRHLLTGSPDSVAKVDDKHINVYSFALKPEEHQPSGTCNFSRIDNAQLDTQDCSVVYAVNYNVLRIMSGMGKHLTAHNSKLPSWIHRPTMMNQQCNSMAACAC